MKPCGIGLFEETGVAPDSDASKAVLSSGGYLSGQQVLAVNQAALPSKVRILLPALRCAGNARMLVREVPEVLCGLTNVPRGDAEADRDQALQS